METSNLRAQIQAHSRFFDRLVELIPARFYLPEGKDDKVWHRGLSKAAKASAKRKSRERRNKARRARLDPENVLTTLEVLKKHTEEEEASRGNSAQGEFKAESAVKNSHSLTYEDLRERYHRKLQELRKVRNAKPEQAAKVQKKKKSAVNKRKHTKLTEHESNNETAPFKPVSPKRAEAALTDSMVFTPVHVGEEQERNKKKRRLSKLKALETAQKLAEERKEAGEGEIIAKKHGWNAATNRAMGVKVHDDPKLLKRSLKKEKIRRRKSAKTWRDRVDAVEKRKDERQQKRKEHIFERIHQKKMRKIAKREKKLMRPGFEGRKEGYINE